MTVRSEGLQIVLMYHGVGEENIGRGGMASFSPAYNVTTACFERHLEALDSSAFGVRVFEGEGRVSEKGTVVLTFDDGLKGNYENAFPLLSKWEKKAVFFVVPGLVGKRGYMSWGQIRELERHGMVVGSHGMTHRPLGNLTADSARGELEISKRMIEDELSCEVGVVSFPHGSYTWATVGLAAECGYRVVCTSRYPRAWRKAWVRGREIEVCGRVAVQGRWGEKKLLEELNLTEWGRRGRILLQEAKILTRRCIGTSAYRRLYRWRYGIENPGY